MPSDILSPRLGLRGLCGARTRTFRSGLKFCRSFGPEITNVLPSTAYAAMATFPVATVAETMEHATTNPASVVQ